MCRLLGVVAPRRAALSELLAADLAGFRALACEHADGWGLAYTDATDALALAKEPERADHSDRFESLVACSITDAAILHLRLASPGLPVRRGNTHPFGDRAAAFAHNGSFAPPTAIDALLGERGLSALEGDTDSERYYRAVRRRLDDGVEPEKALTDAAADIRAAADEYSSLNSLLLTPDALYAYTDHDPASEIIARRGEDFFDLYYRAEPEAVVVASVGWPHPEPLWTRLPPRHVLRVGRRDLRTTVYVP